MKVIIGKTAGFCYGVKRAIEEAQNQIKENKNIYCLGELVHNTNVIKKLEKRGIIFVNKKEDVEDNVIIRAHGAEKELYNYFQNKNINIIDLTCPNVLLTHKIAEEYNKKNYFIILIGIKNHPEAIATLSFCGDNSFLMQEKEDIDNLLLKINKLKINNILIMAQTTYNSKKFDEIIDLLNKKLQNNNIVVKKTICGATEIRQKETMEIACKVDIMIVVGDKKSSNTNKLYDISREYCNNVLFIQDEVELDFNKLEGIDTVGIMAGASTPQEDIDRVLFKINNLR